MEAVDTIIGAVLHGDVCFITVLTPLEIKLC